MTNTHQKHTVLHFSDQKECIFLPYTLHKHTFQVQIKQLNKLTQLLYNRSVNADMPHAIIKIRKKKTIIKLPKVFQPF